jgi:hypothetical protein
MDRVTFVESVHGIKYPEMIVDFFDHFIALKQIVEDTGTISVINNEENSIEFSILFSSSNYMRSALNIINSLNGNIIIYGRNIMILVEVLTDSEIKIKLFN